MSTNEATVTGRCEDHPGRPAVGRCEACGKLLCIGCAIPVRGQVLGPECVAEVLGPEVAADAALPARRAHRVGRGVAGLGFLGVLGASVLPWTTRFSSHAAGPFGGWEFSPVTWSLLASLGGAVGLAAWALIRRNRAMGRHWRWVLAGLAVLAAVGAVLFLLSPPPFSHPSLGPWVALAAAALSLGGTVWDARASRRPPRISR